MNVPELPVEVITIIALVSPQSYKRLLALPPFARYARKNRCHIVSNFTRMVESSDHIKRYYTGNKLHREGDLPAVYGYDGTCKWYKDGKLHRDGGLPAVINGSNVKWATSWDIHYEYLNVMYGVQLYVSAGGKEWWQNGKLHRDGDMPAVEWVSGHKEWYQEGIRHRGKNLPAVICANGDKYWYWYGLLHRGGDLPAVERVNGTQEWYYEGKQHRDGDLPAEKNKCGVAWYQNGELHRDGDMPAAVNMWQKTWYWEGNLYRDREDQPVIEYNDGNGIYIHHSMDKYREQALAEWHKII